MASGYGINGGQSRCFQFWQAVAKCYAEADKPGKCTLYKEDYLECLHHRKAIAKDQAFKRELKKAQREGAADHQSLEDIYKSMGSSGGISTGLIERTLEEGKLTEPIDYSGREKLKK